MMRTVIGDNCHAKHDGAILVGSGLVSDRPYQIKIGSPDGFIAYNPSMAEWTSFREALLRVTAAVQNEPPVDDGSMA